MTSNNQTGLDNLYRTALAQDSKISDLQQIVAVDREQLKFVTSNLRGLDSLLTTMTELELNVNTNTELLSATPGIATGGKALILHSSGDVTIGGDLKIKTLSTPVIGKITPIYARGTGFNNHSNRLVHIGDTTVLNDNVRGLTLIIINAETHAEVSTTNYDTFLGSTWGDALATAIEGLGDDQIGLIVSCDAWEASYFSMGTNLKVAALRVGLPRLAAMTEYITNGRHPYAAIFYGSGSTTLPGNQAIEIIKSHGGDAAYATLSTFLVNDSFIGQVPASALYHPSGDIRNGAYYLPEPIVYINEDGRVGIGTTSPQSFLHVAGNTYLDGDLGIGTASPGKKIDVVGGDIRTNGGIIAASSTIGSDDRLKHNEEDISDSLSVIRKLKPQKYQKTKEMKAADFNETLEEDDILCVEAGFIAQEIQKVPELAYSVTGGDYTETSEDSEGVVTTNEVASPHYLNYNNILTYNVAATQELDTTVTGLLAKVAALEARLKVWSP